MMSTNEPEASSGSSATIESDPPADVKPHVKPFPLDVDMTRSVTPAPIIKPEPGTARIAPRKTPARAPTKTPSRKLKKEYSPVDVGAIFAGDLGSPIYISSDTDDDEVDAQMDVDQPTSDRASSVSGALAKDGEAKDSKPGAEETAEDQDEQKSEEEDEIDEEEDEGKDEQQQDEAGPGTGAGDKQQVRSPTKEVSREPSVPTSDSSSSQSPPPFMSQVQPRPKPKPVSVSKSPERKRPFVSASQPTQSSRLSAGGRASVSIEPRAFTQIPKIDEDSGEEEEETKRYGKRARLSVASTSTNKGKSFKRPPSMHPKYWLLDGSVRLQIGNTVFRLHRSRLNQQSRYFKQLFSKGATRGNESGSEPEDNKKSAFESKCPLYHIDVVTVRDFEELLAALDDAISYVFKPPEFSQLAAILRAARALEFDSLCEFASRMLRAMWPSTLEELTTKRIPHASETVLLARACEMPDILKRAFYELVRTSQLGQDEEADLEDPEVASRQISRQDLARLIKARQELTARWIWAADKPPEIQCPVADNDPPTDEGIRCIQARANNLSHWHEHVKKSLLFEECLYDPLDGLKRLVDIDWEEKGYCRGCAKLWRDSWTAQRQKLWDQLDVWLGLPVEEENGA